MFTSGLLLTVILLGAGQPEPPAAELLAKLDLTSFPNSTGPRRLARPATPEAAGFTQTSSGEGWAIRTGGDWRIGLRVLAVRGEALDVCFTDVAENGGSYFVQTVLTLTAAGEGYAARKGPAHAGCPERRSRSDAAPRS